MNSYCLDSLATFLQHARQRYEGSPAPSQEQWEGDQARTGETQDDEGYLIRKHLWDRLSALRDSGDTVTGVVTGWNRGGLLVRWEDLQGFVPASQMADVPVFPDEASRDEILSRWVGEELHLKVIELDPARNRLVFSERAAAWGPRQGEQLLANLQVGDVREGVVSNVCDFGAFVDLGGVDGLIHISEISWGRVTHPGNLLSIGDPVRVMVLTIDQASHHVGLSIKRLLQNPWAVVDIKYGIGDIVEAQVTNVVDFGAFVQLEQGLEGLVHISELSEQRIAHPGQLLNVGQTVRVRVLRIEKEHHRLSLSIKQAQTADSEDDLVTSNSAIEEEDTGDSTLFY